MLHGVRREYPSHPRVVQGSVTIAKSMKPFVGKNSPSSIDLLCFSHLRWDFVYQRPQHLMSRFAEGRRVLFIEEPMDHEGDAKWRFSEEQGHLVRCVPMLPADRDRSDDNEVIRGMVDE